VPPIIPGEPRKAAAVPELAAHTVVAAAVFFENAWERESEACLG
jgi:hypothetical protein